MGKRWLWFFVMIFIGGCLGLVYAWVVEPVDFVNATFGQLRQDYKADHVLMTSEIYNKDGQLFKALMRLEMLGEDSVESAVRMGINTAENLAYSSVDLEMMNRLRRAVTGEKATATPVIDLTLAASFLNTEAPTTEPKNAPTPEPPSAPDQSPFDDEAPAGNIDAPLMEIDDSYENGEADSDDFFRKID